MTLISLTLAIAGLAMLALSMHRHAVSAGLSRAGDRPVRLGGWGLLLLSMLARIAAPDWRIGLLEWIGQLALCAAAVTLVLTYRPTLLPRAIVPVLAVALLVALRLAVRT